MPVDFQQAAPMPATFTPSIPGPAMGAQISADPGNQLTFGSDAKLLVPGGYDFDSLVSTNLGV